MILNYLLRAKEDRVAGQLATRTVQAGIAQKDIPKFLMQAAINGKQVGMQGADRTIFETVFNGVKQRVAVQISKNGFIVGANIKSK